MSDGIISGAENVGGILGAEAGIDQPWDNAKGEITNNVFKGKVSGTKRVGAIIGYIRALNINVTISGNTYKADCGTEKGIGEVAHVDTDAVAFGLKDGVMYFNTAKYDDYTAEEWATIYETVDNDWMSTSRNKGRSIAKKNYNRHDDPLGADADKLTKVIVPSKEEKDLDNAIESMSEEVKATIDPEILAKVEESQEKAAEINHKDGDVVVDGVKWNIKVDASVAEATSAEAKTIEESAGKKLEDGTALVVYDITLTDVMTGTKVEPGEDGIKITLPVPESTKGFEHIMSYRPCFYGKDNNPI